MQYKRYLSLLSVFVLLATFAPPALAYDVYDVQGGSADSAFYNSWTISGPNGGDLRTIVIDPKDKNRLYASTLDGQVFTSADAGKNWRLLVNLNQPQLVLDDFIVDWSDSKKLYVSGHRHKAPGGFFRSTDGGLTWKESKELKNESIHSLTQSPTDAAVLLAGTVNGVWISSNSGEDWSKISSSSMPVNIDSLAIDPRSTNTIYAGTWWRAYKTTDAGKNWSLIKDGMIDDSDVFAISIDPRNPEHVISSACSGIYESFNGGQKWAKIQGIPSQSRRTRDIVQHPTLPSTIYAATTEGFWMSTNGGKAWSMTTQRNLEINSIAVHPDEPNRVYIATNNYGVMVSNDAGRNFTQTNDDLTTRFTYAILTDRQQPNRVYAATRNTATGGGFFFISDDGGTTWRPSASIDVNRTSPFTVIQDRANPALMYMGTNAGVLRSLDRGVTWSAVAVPKAKAPVKKAPAKKGAKAVVKKTVISDPVAAAGPRLTPLMDKVKVLAFTEDGKGGLLAGTDVGLFRTYDLAKGWEKLDLGANNSNVLALHTAATRPETIWVGTATSGVLVSRDGGKTFSKAGGAGDGVPVSSIATDPERPDYVYVGTSQTFYLSRDGGKTWMRRGGNLPIGNFTSILIDPNNTDEIIISSAMETDGGIYVSTDAGMRWKRIDGKDLKLPSRRVWSLAFDPQDTNRLYAGSHSSGVYKIDLKAGLGAVAAPKAPATSNP